MGLFIEEVNENNWRECVNLKVADNQRDYIEDNALSIAQSKYEPQWIPVCIYYDDKMIGFAMHGTDIDNGHVWLDRFMIDERYQGNGYGSLAIKELIKLLQSTYKCNRIYLSTTLNNKGVQKFYEQFGFKATGELECGEDVMILDL